jgi:hypothetical protein
MRRLLVLLAGAAVVLVGNNLASAALPSKGAGAFMKGVVRQIVTNDYEHAWLSLHPAQQQLVPQDDYVRCELQSPIAGRLAWIKVVRVTNARFAVGGLARRVAGKAVALRIKLVDDDSGASVVVAHTAHAVAVAGRWRWILPAQRIGLYSSSACTAEAPPPGP